MSHNPGSGYKGFRSWSVQPCPTLKPGDESFDRSSKFSQMAYNMMYKNQPIMGSRTSSFDTVSNSNFNQVKPSDFKIPDKRGVMTKNDKRQTSKKDLPFIGCSSYQKLFIPHQKEANRVYQSSVEQYREAFDRLIATNNQNQDEQALLNCNQIKDVLKTSQSDNINSQFLRIFATTAEKKTDGNLTWEQFSQIFSETQEYVYKELQGNSMDNLTKEDQLYQNLNVAPISTGQQYSSYRTDFGAYGDNPIDRGYVRKTGTATTTGDLNKGTSKDSFHVPGYGGFIARTSHNAVAIDQGDAKDTRTAKGDLRLYHSDNIPGYTGYKAHDCSNYRGEFKTGTDTSTTSGAFFKPFN